jgi:predicted lipoprotein with Yx(FWY)xxD motif
MGVFNMLKTIACGFLISTMVAGSIEASAAGGEPAMMAKTAMGKAWVDAKGMALYTYDKDKGGKSMCNDKCSIEWPPLAANSKAKDIGAWTLLARDDGSTMWAYKGHPPYTFVGDKKPGEVTGDKKDGFHLAK